MVLASAPEPRAEASSESSSMREQGPEASGKDDEPT